MSDFCRFLLKWTCHISPSTALCKTMNKTHEIMSSISICSLVSKSDAQGVTGIATAKVCPLSCAWGKVPTIPFRCIESFSRTAQLINTRTYVCDIIDSQDAEVVRVVVSLEKTDRHATATAAAVVE